jgi:Arabinose efflux permease
MSSKQASVFSLGVIVAALGYFVDIYDLLLFGIIRIESLRDLGLTESEIAKKGLLILNVQMAGLLIGGFLWGVLADKKGRLKVLFASIILYSLGNIANGFVQTVNQYALIRFITGIGLAGELGVGITLVVELLPKEKRGIGAAIVAGFGLTGAVVAYFIKQAFDWRICYFIGGGLGFLLLMLRVGVLESAMFKNIEHRNVSKGNFFMLFNKGRRVRKYIFSILIGLPTWYVIGILVSFSKEFAEGMGVTGKIDPGKSIMFAYATIAVGDIAAGLLSQVLRSRKNALYIFYAITAIGLLWFFNGTSVASLYGACALLGFGTGFWSIFVTMAAEQFGTNIRATVTTTVPNMVRGALILISLLFTWLQTFNSYVTSGLITGIVAMVIGIASVILSEETFHKDLNYVEEEEAAPALP